MAAEDKVDIPLLARRCWDRFRVATQEQREEEKVSAGFWIGGKHQWRPGETETREGKQRPWMTVNRCKPLVDQVENEARMNPPGPQCHPVGGGADSDGADILEGLIREYEYRSDAQTSYMIALRNACARMRGPFELATEYIAERSFEQQLVVKGAPNPDAYFYDPDAIKPNREDCMWQGKILALSREQLIADYGPSLKVLGQNFIDRASGWMQDALGVNAADRATLSAWTGGNSGSQNTYGPFYLCEFWRVETKHVKLTLYSDHIARFSDEEVPAGVEVQLDDDDEPMVRSVGKRQIVKYLVTALDELSKTDWPGDQIPIFWVMGPELWREGKCHRHSLISDAIDPNRLLNYAVTTAAELVGSMNKSPYIGYQGQFNVQNAQGMNPWLNNNGTLWPYLEVKPIFLRDEATGATQLAPLPQRNTWEAPIERVMELANMAVEQIKAVASVFFEPSLAGPSKVQSGKAIQALQQQSNVGTLNWQDNLRRAVGLSYREAGKVMQTILDGYRTRTIVRPDGNHEMAEINKEFASGGPGASMKRKNNISDGQFSIRATAGPNFQTLREKTVQNLTQIFQIVPQMLSMPGVAAQFLRMAGEGDPQIEQIADSMDPNAQVDQDNPEQQKQVLAKMTAENQQLKQGLQQMQAAIQQKLPEIESKKWIAALNAVAGIREAEIKAGVDLSAQDVSTLEHITGLVHDAASTAAQHAHEAAQQTSQQQAAAQQQQIAGQQAQQQQASAQANQPDQGQD